MEFGYEERSKRFIERLDRIQNYLQSLPPLPKIGSASTSALKAQSRNLYEVLRSASSHLSVESAESVDSNTTRQLVSTVPSRAIRKDECAGKLLQRLPPPSPSPSSSKTNASSGSSPQVPQSSVLGIVPDMKRKKRTKHKDDRVQDPLRPTCRKSFGVDIGQGINAINYIKQNAKSGSEYMNNRLTNIIVRDISPALHTDRSMDRIYKQGPLTADTSALSMQFKNREAELSRNKTASGKQMGSSGSPSPSNLTSSDTEIYRVKYQERAIDLPHHHGLDVLQELFVPYMEHDPCLEPEPPRVPSDCE